MKSYYLNRNDTVEHISKTMQTVMDNVYQKDIVRNVLICRELKRLEKLLVSTILNQPCYWAEETLIPEPVERRYANETIC